MTTAEQFIRLRDLMEARAEATRMAGFVQGEIDELRATIRAEMETAGTRSLRDQATGFSARIEARTAWKVTDWEALHCAVEDDVLLSGELYEYQINTQRVLDMAKAGRALPGVERVTSETFVVRASAAAGDD